MNTDKSDSRNRHTAHELSRRRLLQILGVSAGATVLGTGMNPAVASRMSAQDNAAELVVGVQAVPENLDPPQNLSNVGNRVLPSMFELLMSVDFANGDPPGTGSEIVPRLATSWERIDDLTLELSLRDDVVFHNGDPFTGADVKFSIERLIGEDVPAEIVNSKAAVATISSVEVVDDYTVRVITAAPDPALEKRLAAMPAWILPKAYFEEQGMEAFSQAPVGTGPYKFIELKADDRLALDAHDGYWGGTPPASNLTFRVIPETSTRVTAIAGNEVQVITNVPPDQVSTLEESDGVGVNEVPLANFHIIAFNTKNPAMADKRLRQALRLSIDRQLLIDALWGGKALLTRSAQTPVGWGSLYNEERPYMEYDPDKAKALIEESGYDGTTITYANRPGYYTLGVEAGQAIVAMWQDLGLNAEYQNREDLAWTEDLMVRTVSNGQHPGDPGTNFWRDWGPGGPYQRDFWTPENPRFNELGTEALQALDEDVRFSSYQEMLDIWEDESPGTVLYNPIENYGVREEIEWLPYSFWYLDFRSENLSFT